MRDIFPEFYRPTVEAFDEMWRDALIVLDANVLLNIYRFTPTTRDQFFGVLEQLGERLWIPHQAAFEYQRNRLDVIHEQEKAYGQMGQIATGALNELIKKLRDESSKKYKRHPYFEVDMLIGPINTALSQIQSIVERQQSQHPNLIENDELRDKLDVLLNSKVGKAYSIEVKKRIFAEGKARYAANIPPGFMDNSKEEDDKYGDLLIWRQMMDKAKETAKPIIFVTDDKKKDWWLEIPGKTIGPQPELIAEMMSEAGTRFHMYASERFLEQSTIYLTLSISKATIDEVRDVGQQQLDAAIRSAYENIAVLGAELSSSTSDARDTLSRLAQGFTFANDIGGALRESLALDALNRAIENTPLNAMERALRPSALDALNRAMGNTPLDAIERALSESSRMGVMHSTNNPGLPQNEVETAPNDLVARVEETPPMSNRDMLQEDNLSANTDKSMTVNSPISDVRKASNSDSSRKVRSARRKPKLPKE